MAAKRSGADLDPDYEDAAEHQAKRQRFIEEDAKEASVKKIEGILDRQLRMAVEDKEQEVKEVDQRLHHARAMMDRLRAVIVASYYSRLQQAPGKMMTSEAPLPSIHPTVKKHIGKAPVGMDKGLDTNDDQSGQSSQSSASSATGGLNGSSAASSLRRQGALPTSTTSDSTAAAVATTLPLTRIENAGSRFTVKKTIIVGNVSRFILPDQREANDQSTHKWMVYVRGPSDDQRIDSFVSKVWFFLHPSYRPNDLVEVSTPPFHLTRRGWGVFPVRVQLHFWDARNKRVDIIHNLKLDETYTGLQTLGAETVVEIELLKDPPSASSRPQLLSNPQPSDQVIVEASVKQEPHDSDSAETPTQTSHKCQCPCQPSPNKDCCRDPKDSAAGASGREGVCAKNDGEAVRPDGTVMTIKEEPPDDYSVEGSSLIADQGVDQGNIGSANATSKSVKSDGCSSKFACDPSNQHKELDGNTHKDSSVDVGDLNKSTTDAKVSFSGREPQASSSLPAEPTCHLAALTTVGAGGSFILSADTMSSSNTLNLHAPVRTTSLLASSASVPRTDVSLQQTHVPQSSSAGSKSFSLLSASQHGSMRTSNASPQPAQVLRMGDSKPEQRSLLTGASVPVEAKVAASSEGIPTVTAPSPLLKVTTQGLRPVLSSNLSGGGLVVGTKPSTQGHNVSLLHSKTDTEHGTKAAQEQGTSLLEPRPTAEGKTFSLLGRKPSKQGQKQHLLNPKTLSAGQKTSVSDGTFLPQNATTLPVVTLQTLASLSQGMSAKSKVGTSNTSLLQGKGMCSLLNTAPKPAVQALLQQRLLSASNPSSSATTTGSASVSVSTLLSPVSASVLSSTSAVSSSSSSPRSSPVPLTLSPGDSYVVANLNNKKVLMRINSASLKKIQDASPAGHVSGSTTLPASNTPSSSSSSFLFSSLQLALQAKSSGLTSPLGVAQNGSVGTKPSSSDDAKELQWKTGSKSESQDHSQGQGPKSRAGLELAKVKAAMQEAQRVNLAAKAVLQMNRLKASMQGRNLSDTPPPKSRCARWFRQGLGSSLVPTATEEALSEMNEWEKNETESEPGEERKAERTDHEKGEKRIMVLKKQRVTDVDDAMVCPVPSLSVDEFLDLTSLIRAAVLRHPLIAPSTEKCTHPYSTTSVEQWLEWHPAKRTSAEWSRAFAVRKYLQRHLGTDGAFKGEQLWSTKRVMQWCRIHGLSPNGPGGRPVFDSGSSADSTKAELVNKRFVSLSGADALLSSFPPVDKDDRRDENSEDSDETLDVEVIREEFPQTVPKIKKEKPMVLDTDLDFLPRSDEAIFVQDTAAQIGVQFFPSVIAPGVVSSTAEDMIFAAMLEFASDIIHQACSFSLINSRGHTVSSWEVFQALKTLPAASFFTNQHCGVLDPSSSTKR